MDFSPFIQTLFGATVGAGAVIVTNRIGEHRKKRSDIQDWFEKTYITEGLDRIIIFLKSLEVYYLSQFINFQTDALNFPKPENIPLEAISRIEALMNVDHFTKIILLAYPAICSENIKQRDIGLKAVVQVMKYLYEIRNIFLENIPKVAHKHTLGEKSLLPGIFDKVFAEMSDQLIETARESNTEFEESDGI